MSSQGSKTVAGVETIGFSGDASNWITAKKQKVLYKTLKGKSSKLAFNLAQSNELRLDYNFGFIGCTTCSGAFSDLTTGSVSGSTSGSTGGATGGATGEGGDF